MIKQWMPNSTSIQWKVVAIIMVVVLFSILSAAVTIINYEQGKSTTNERYRVESIAEILSQPLTAAVVFQDEFTANELLLPLMSDPTVIDVNVLTNKNEKFLSLDSPHVNTDGETQLHLVISRPLIYDGTVYGRLVVRLNDLAVKKHIRAYTVFIGFIASITLCLSLIMAIIFARYIIRPILRLGRLAHKVTETNNYALRATVVTRDEIGQLTHNFNLMLQNIEQRDHNLEKQVKQRTLELEVVNDKLQKQAYGDSLSGLPNRRYLNERLRKHVYDFARGKSIGFSMLFLDLDGFKEVNDTMGHDYGDVLLVAASKRLRASVRPSDLVARLGGDEFTILIPDVIKESVSTKVAHKIREALREPFIIKGEEVTVTVSIGIAVFPTHGSTVESILKCADLAMYEAKAEGRDCYKYFNDSMMQALLNKRKLVTDLKQAISEQQFEVYYQPIMDLTSGDMVKVEALIRWNHPSGGMIFPNDFISIAEEFGIITEIGAWVLNKTTQDAKALKDAFGRDIQVCINVSPSQFKGDFEWATSWLESEAANELSRGSISFEITEHLLMTSDDIVRERLEQLKRAGIEIAIDDFGVGYSSLSYLQQIDVDTLKIDRSFVRYLEIDSSSQALCKAMINMAEELGIRIVAEGVENQEQADLLASFGCCYGQGYYFSYPVPLAELITKQPYFCHSRIA